MLIILGHHTLSGLLGLSYYRIYFMLSSFMSLKVGKSHRDLPKSHAMSSICCFVNAISCLDKHMV